MPERSSFLRDAVYVCMYVRVYVCVYVYIYTGEVKLDALSSFLRDTLEGSDAVIAMHQQICRHACMHSRKLKLK